MTYKQVTWWKSNIAWLKGWIELKKASLIGWGLILTLFVIYFIIIGHPRFIASLNPTKVPARITYIYHTQGSRGYMCHRYYNYEYKYDGKIYHGHTFGQLDEIIGGIGDTIIIRCNKDYPKYSWCFLYPDNPNLKIRKLSKGERLKIYKQEPSEYDMRKKKSKYDQ